MASNIEIILNNCLKYIPSSSPFHCDEILKKAGKGAYFRLKFPVLAQQPKYVESDAIGMENYLLIHQFADKFGDAICMNEKGRRLIKIGEIDEFYRIEWWGKNYKMMIAILGVIIGIITLFLRIKSN